MYKKKSFEEKKNSVIKIVPYLLTYGRHRFSLTCIICNWLERNLYLFVSYVDLEKQIYFAIFKSTCTVINHLRYYFLFDSEIKSNIDNLFRSHYEIQDLLDNDIDAILSRIDYIERNEPRSNYGVVWMKVYIYLCILYVYVYILIN